MYLSRFCKIWLNIYRDKLTTISSERLFEQGRERFVEKMSATRLGLKRRLRENASGWANEIGRKFDEYRKQWRPLGFFEPFEFWYRHDSENVCEIRRRSYWAYSFRPRPWNGRDVRVRSGSVKRLTAKSDLSGVVSNEHHSTFGRKPKYDEPIVYHGTSPEASVARGWGGGLKRSASIQHVNLDESAVKLSMVALAEHLLHGCVIASLVGSALDASQLRWAIQKNILPYLDQSKASYLNIYLEQQLHSSRQTDRDTCIGLQDV